MIVKGELKPEISLLHMKVLTLIKAKRNVFLWYVQCCSCARRSKTKILTTRAPPSWIEFWHCAVKRDILNMACDCWFPCSFVYWSLVKARKDGGALVVNILFFDLRVQLQHCTYQRKTLLFALGYVHTVSFSLAFYIVLHPQGIRKQMKTLRKQHRVHI